LAITDATPLAQKDFYLFGPLKDTLHGTRFEDDDSMIRALRTWLGEEQGRQACPCFALA